MNIKIKTYFIKYNSDVKAHEQEIIFDNYNDAEIYLKDRIQLLTSKEIFKFEFDGNSFPETNKTRFRFLDKLKEAFEKEEIINNKNAEKEKNKTLKSERIYIRYSPSEKEELTRNAKAENLTISEFIRQSSLNGARIHISNEEKRILTNASLNFNQFMRAINELIKIGEPISKERIENAFSEWEIMSTSFRGLIDKYESRKPRNDSQDD